MADELYKLIQDVTKEQIMNLRVCLPGKIEKYDPDTHLASVQPLIKRKFYRRKDSELLPIINRVPVVFPRSSTAIVRLPVNIGDIVLLVFADRSIENWLTGKGEARDPLDTRFHHLNDAFAIPGGYPEGLKRVSDNPEALEIWVQSGTKITIGNGAEEILQLAHDAFTSLKTACEQLSQTLTDIQAITVTAPSGGGVTSTPINATSFASIKTQVDTITNNVNTTITSLEKIKV